MTTSLMAGSWMSAQSGVQGHADSLRPARHGGRGRAWQVQMQGRLGAAVVRTRSARRPACHPTNFYNFFLLLIGSRWWAACCFHLLLFLFFFFMVVLGALVVVLLYCLFQHHCHHHHHHLLVLLSRRRPCSCSFSMFHVLHAALSYAHYLCSPFDLYLFSFRCI